ncbi:hypothetical protein [Streptomyces spectabilis]|uniref:Uncharacterized protein n=1 Tax=Streptomyces spectabilis TaxID=68270 RepID=A0A516RCN5_STRST|nr:hypothetical protein [Streptomyces spectabilis]QDQ13415.1 hypothetical protein FH965_24975 [Streptomyces spectabilis]
MRAVSSMLSMLSASPGPTRRRAALAAVGAVTGVVLALAADVARAAATTGSRPGRCCGMRRPLRVLRRRRNDQARPVRRPGQEGVVLRKA